MTTVERLLDGAADVWQKYHEHPFVRGIADGTLDRGKFRFYIIQDYLYLQDYLKSFALGVAKAKTQKTAEIFAHNITLLTEEMNIHHGYMGSYGVTQAELEQTRAHLDNLSYTSYMLRVAYEEGEAEILAAILSCAYSYEVIAKRMVADCPECMHREFYGDWIRGYACDGFSAGNAILIEALNRLTASYSEAQLAHLCEIFRTCSKYELLFWDLGWAGTLD